MTGFTVCVFCGASRHVDQRYLDLATEVGRAVAARGWELVTGGGSVGLMGAVVHAARAGGARTVGVIPEALTRTEVADTGGDELVVTADMRTRKAEMDRRSDAFLALPGGIGTLEELLEVWTSRSLAMHAKPVVVLDPDDAFAPLRLQAAQLVARGFMRQEVADAVAWTSTVDAALMAIEAGGAAPAAPTPEELAEAEVGEAEVAAAEVGEAEVGEPDAVRSEVDQAEEPPGR